MSNRHLVFYCRILELLVYSLYPHIILNEYMYNQILGRLIHINNYFSVDILSICQSFLRCHMIWPMLFQVKVFFFIHWPYHLLHSNRSYTTFELSKVYSFLIYECVVHLRLLVAKYDIHPIGVQTILFPTAMST